MRIADLYIRVSTDEQAEKGYSIRSQQDNLERYCKQNGFEIRKVFIEDYSARTFNRPEWKRYLKFSKNYNGTSTYLLFTKWDRFSRNTSDAYQMISTLNRYSISPQAIEQELDLSIPENKMLLAIYLTAPEIENDHKSINTKAGIRQAKKEGKWTGIAPYGYINRTSEDGKKYIVQVQAESAIVKWIFSELCAGMLSPANIYLLAKDKGLVLSINGFHALIKNKMYCGKIAVAAFKNEKAYYVTGQYESIISEELYYKAQQRLDSRRIATRLSCKENLIFTGYLFWFKCGKKLSSVSYRSGQRNMKAYYECNRHCGTRFKASVINEKILENVMNCIPHWIEMQTIIRDISLAYKSELKNHAENNRLIQIEISKLVSKIRKARALLVHDELDHMDFEIIKNKYSQEIEVLESKLHIDKRMSIPLAELKKLAKCALENLSNLSCLYSSAGTAGKRYLIKNIFTNHFEFENLEPKSSEVNQLAKYFYHKNQERKKRENNPLAHILSLIIYEESKLELTHSFVEDLKILSGLEIKMREYDNLSNRLIELKKDLPVVEKKKSNVIRVRKKRLSRKIAIKKWILNAMDD